MRPQQTFRIGDHRRTEAVVDTNYVSLYERFGSRKYAPAVDEDSWTNALVGLPSLFLFIQTCIHNVFLFTFFIWQSSSIHNLSIFLVRNAESVVDS